MAECRGCGAEIKWIKSPNDKWLPVDPELVELDELESGMSLVTEDGEIVKADAGRADADDEPRTGYVAHWSTCPKADQFRRK